MNIKGSLEELFPAGCQLQSRVHATCCALSYLTADLKYEKVCTVKDNVRIMIHGMFLMISVSTALEKRLLRISGAQLWQDLCRFLRTHFSAFSLFQASPAYNSHHPYNCSPCTVHEVLPPTLRHLSGSC